MKFKIQSKMGVAGVQFGWFPERIRQSLSSDYRTFLKTPDCEYPCDRFDSLGVFAFYDKNRELEALEFTVPAVLEYAGEGLLSMPYPKLLRIFEQIGPSLKVEVDGFTSIKLGIGAYAPNGQLEPDRPAESVIVFREGYYDL